MQINLITLDKYSQKYINFQELQDKGCQLPKIIFIKGNLKKDFLMVMVSIEQKQYSLQECLLMEFQKEKEFKDLQKDYLQDRFSHILKKVI